MIRLTICLPIAIACLATGALVPCHAAASRAAAAAPDDAIFEDWLLQDAADDADECFSGNDDATQEAAIVTAAIDELEGGAKRFRAMLTDLRNTGVPGNDDRWLALYRGVCGARRRQRLRILVDKFPKIIFTKHYDIGGSHYAYTEGQSDAQAERHFRGGSALCLLQLDDEGTTRVRTLIDDKKGVIRDPAVSYDGKRVLFAWKKSNRQDDYHLYEMAVEGGQVRQITFGLGVADYEPAYLPDGDIIFNSTRCVQIVDCWWTEVSNLYVCDGNGDYLRRLSFDQVHTNYPQVLDDGRVIYTRWDYNDRGQVYPQPLFQMNYDGTKQREFYGNNSWFPTTILHARGIPGTRKVVAVLSGHHCHQRGKLAIIDPAKGRQEATGVQLIAPVRETKAVRVDAYGQNGEQFQYPFAVNETQFIVTYTPTGSGNRRYDRPFGIYLMNIDGRRELLALDPKISCNQPVPLAARPKPHVRPSNVDYREATGTYYVEDVYAGPGLKGIERGTVKSLRVVTMEFRAAGVGSNRSGGPGGGALSSTPPSIDNGTWDVKKVLGSVPIAADGSACFEVPARTPVYFQLLDKKNQVVQSMRTWSTLQPGETYACAGCHEHKNGAPPSPGRRTLALQKGPQKLKPFYGPSRGFSFPKEVQPVFDKHCIRCHNDRTAKRGAATDAGEQVAYAGMPVPLESQWRYTMKDPGDGWHKPGFDASSWRTGKAGFGRKGTPGGTVRTHWDTPDIWLRHSFELPGDWRPEASHAALRFCHDEDIEIYLNGGLVKSEEGHTSEFKKAPAPPDLLEPGQNVIAVHCRQTSGGQFVDVAILLDEHKGDEPMVKTKKAFSLLDARTTDNRAKREWSDSYLALTNRGKPNKIVKWLNVQSIPPMLPPYYAGSAKSELMAMLENRHNGVKLSREELDKIACWIDLLVPFCGDYTEANAWNEGQKEKYSRYLAKRRRMAAIDQRNIEALIAKRHGSSKASADTARAYHNVALNPNDVGSKPESFPHATSNSECRNEPCFAARCAIDGKIANTGHGSDYPSWGPDKQTDLWWKVDFGRPVEVDKLVLYIRADFPHDDYWHSGVIEFSDGTSETISIRKTAEPQAFSFPRRTITWLKLTDLKQTEPLGWCAFTEVEVWGRRVVPEAFQ